MPASSYRNEEEDDHSDNDGGKSSYIPHSRLSRSSNRRGGDKHEEGRSRSSSSRRKKGETDEEARSRSLSIKRRSGSKTRSTPQRTYSDAQGSKEKNGRKVPSRSKSSGECDPPKFSLEAGLKKVGGLKRRDFGRGADDNDTFCVGDKEESKAGLKNAGRPQNPMLGKPKRSGGGLGGGLGGGMFNRHDEEEEEEEEDFFASANNPFKQFR